ncbi:hypothetical protein RIF29_42212 [Crotalaria pallida]|uniref:Uncharacterized protein n=1 Tax=Crotalaria pallida TaxID=3830 RepID=A0AAN9E7Q4_CROPI
MQNDKVAKELTYEDNSDDAQSNDEEEARLTWEIGKMLGLKAANEEQNYARVAWLLLLVLYFCCIAKLFL